MNAKTFVIRHGFYLVPVIIFLLTGIVFLGLFHKDAIHLTQNAWYSPFFDSFFKYITYLGDGMMFLPVAFILIFIKWRYLIGLVISGILTLLIVGLLKNVVYANELRPVKYFEELKKELRLVDGVEMNEYNSFPSGHSTSAFACFGLLGLVVRHYWAQILCFLTAALVGYSRIYLSQHFLEDVVAGAALGTAIAILSHYLMSLLPADRYDSRVRLKKRSS